MTDNANDLPCKRGEWLTKDLCPDYGSSDCPLLFSDAECGVDDEHVSELLESFNRYCMERIKR